MMKPVLKYLMLFLTTIPLQAQGATKGLVGELKWRITRDSTLIISGKGAMSDYGYPKLRDGEFYYEIPWWDSADRIKKIVVEEGVTSIGEHIFSCLFTKIRFSQEYGYKGHVNLKSVTLPASVTDIKSGAFIDCNNLQEVIMPASSVVNIAERAFSRCERLANFDMPNSVTNIGNGAFESCKNLINVKMSAGLIYTGFQAFRGTALTTITLPRSLAAMGEQVFVGCRKLENIDVERGNANFLSYDGVLYDVSSDTKLICYPAAKTKSDYSAPPIIFQLSAIAPYAFFGCHNLANITIPESVFYIGECAFSMSELSSQLTEITIPASVCEMHTNAFLNCTNLKTVTCLAPAPPFARRSYLIIEYWGEHPKYADTLRVPAASVAAYKADPEWGVAFRNIVAIE